jgi:GH15 family glucan-1,4-alpha-glucosidase
MLGQHNYIEPWIKTRDAIRREIYQKGWNEKMKAFTQCYDNNDMDAANLLMANYGFIDPKDPKFVSTVEKTQEELSQDGLMYRYKNKDDFGMPSSAFTVCSFWLVKALFQTGKRKEAIKLFDNLLKHGNHLGLFSEDMDFKSKRLLGNFPQGYSHLSLIDAATALTGTSVEENEAIMNRIEHIHETRKTEVSQ